MPNRIYNDKSNQYLKIISKNTNYSDNQECNKYAGRNTHTSPVKRTKDNAGLHLKANKSYLLNEQRKERLRHASI